MYNESSAGDQVAISGGQLSEKVRENWPLFKVAPAKLSHLKSAGGWHLLFFISVPVL